MTLPPRKRPARSGIERAPQRSWPKHERWVRGFQCSVASDGCEGRIEFAHVRQGGNAGTGIKPPSWQGMPLCAAHHRQQHLIGHAAFDRVHGIQSLKLAAEFAARSPDIKMAETLKTLRYDEVL